MTGGRKHADRGSTANRSAQRMERAPAPRQNKKLTVRDLAAARTEREATLYNLESDLADLCDRFLHAHYNDEHAAPAIDNLRVGIAAWEQAGGGA